MRSWKIVRAGFVSVCVLLIAAVICFAAPDVNAENYKIPGQGDLHLDIPTGWTYELDNLKPSLPPTIITSAGDVSKFKMMITPLWRSDGSSLGFSKEKLKALSEKESAMTLTQAVEDHVDIQELKGKNAYGYCYGVTDKSLVGKTTKAGDYRYMVRCAVVAGEVFLSTTILCQDKNDPIISKAKTILGGARQLK